MCFSTGTKQEKSHCANTYGLFYKWQYYRFPKQKIDVYLQKIFLLSFSVEQLEFRQNSLLSHFVFRDMDCTILDHLYVSSIIQHCLWVESLSEGEKDSFVLLWAAWAVCDPLVQVKMWKLPKLESLGFFITPDACTSLNGAVFLFNNGLSKDMMQRASVSHLFRPLVHSWPLRTVIKVEQYVLTAARLHRGETERGSVESA